MTRALGGEGQGSRATIVRALGGESRLPSSMSSRGRWPSKTANGEGSRATIVRTPSHRQIPRRCQPDYCGTVPWPLPRDDIGSRGRSFYPCHPAARSPVRGGGPDRREGSRATISCTLGGETPPPSSMSSRGPETKGSCATIVCPRSHRQIPRRQHPGCPRTLPSANRRDDMEDHDALRANMGECGASRIARYYHCLCPEG